MTFVLALALAASCGPTNPPATSDVPADQVAPGDVAPDVTMDVAADAPPPRDVAPLDAPTADVRDAAADLPAPMDRVAEDSPPPVDVASDAARDAGPADAPPADGATCSAASGCHAFWCGCGRCNPREITCTPAERGCPLDCASACPELDTAVCRCADGRCGAPVLADAGVDAGPADAATDARSDGGSPEGTLCAATAECAAGLMCCYPCGIPGCSNRCIPPLGGRCPLFP